MVLVWDRWVRVSHWTLAAIVFANQFVTEGGEPWHDSLGYAACALVAIRLVWGVIGSEHARFEDLFASWPERGRFLSHTRDYLLGRAPRTLNHSPLALVGMALMLLCVLLLGVTGWMMSIDRFFGEEWVESAHEILSYVLLAIVGVHVVGVVRESWLHRENLILAMIHGKKRPVQEDA